MKSIITDRYLSMIINYQDKREGKLFLTLLTIVISSILVMNGVFLSPANAQIENCYNLESKNALPVLLIHEWNEGAGGVIPLHWDEWTEHLSDENIPFCIISFEQSPDACGSSSDHAKELAQIVQNIISETGQNQVNIVGFSKGGLDARVYLANDLSNDNVANLIMIGTPNASTQMAFTTNECSPGINDIKPNSSATKAKQNTHTEYYTIAGACFPWIGDGLVSISSVNSKLYFKPLGTSNSCHLDLLDDYEYELANDVLRNRE